MLPGSSSGEADGESSEIGTAGDNIQVVVR